MLKTKINHFHFLELKRFYRKLEEIFESLIPGPSQKFASDFLSAFHNHLSKSLGIVTVYLYERSNGEISLIRKWGAISDEMNDALHGFLRTEELPWFGELENQMVALVRSGQEDMQLLVFVSDKEFAGDPGYKSHFLSAFTSLQYALQQNVKRLELQNALEQARAIQSSLLPSETPNFGEFDFAAVTIPAMLVGGDVYDFQSRDSETLAIIIGDAAGHGLAAALQARDVIIATRTAVASGLEMRTMMGILNDILRRSGLVSRFVSMIYAELKQNGNFSYINAGHPRPLLLSAGELIELNNAGMILGTQGEHVFRPTSIEIPNGSSIILYTDGVVEHQSVSGIEFGKERLKEWMEDWNEAPASMALHALFQRLEDFGHGKPFRDDVTAIYFRRL
ncbi:serine/threonine-protein phosphatase [bacterium]|nr:serine/threonine-protein phosphatase [bacterium]